MDQAASACSRATASRWSRPPARSSATSSTPVSPSCGALGFEAVYDERVFARDRFVAGDATLRAAALHDAWRDPDHCAPSSPCAAATAARRLLPLLDAGADARGAEDSCRLQRHHGAALLSPAAWAGLLSRADDRAAARRRERRLRPPSFLRRPDAPEPLGELRPPGSRRSARARQAASSSAAR